MKLGIGAFAYVQAEAGATIHSLPHSASTATANPASSLEADAEPDKGRRSNGQQHRRSLRSRHSADNAQPAPAAGDHVPLGDISAGALLGGSEDDDLLVSQSSQDMQVHGDRALLALRDDYAGLDERIRTRSGRNNAIGPGLLNKAAINTSQGADLCSMLTQGNCIS